VLIAWLDAGRRRDREAMRALLSPDATWQGIRPEWLCATPDEVIAMWLERSDALDDLETVEMIADGRRAALLLRAPSLEELDERLRFGVHIGFTLDADGRIGRLQDGARRSAVFGTDPARAPRGVAEAPLRDGVPQSDGWFVVNVADTPWKTGFFGAVATFEGDTKRFGRIGINIGVLAPGQPACWYHREDDQEDFLVLKGEALLLIEGRERLLRAWDFVHCPPWTEHVFIGAGAGPSTILALGGRTDSGLVYPVAEVALRHRAGVEVQTTTPKEAYADIPPDRPVAFDPTWLPGE
jgi:uncharacterized cupin superfamily protein